MDRQVFFLQINLVFTYALFFAAATFKGLFLLRGLAFIVSAAKTCEVLFVSTGLAGWWIVCKTNAFWVKVMSWNLDEQLPFVFFATQKLSHLAQVQLFIVVVTDFPSPQKFHICRILQTQLCVLLYWSVMKKIVGGKYTTWKQKSTSISEKINKMAVMPHWHWRTMLNSTPTAPGRFQFK